MGLFNIYSRRLHFWTLMYLRMLSFSMSKLVWYSPNLIPFESYAIIGYEGIQASYLTPKLTGGVVATRPLTDGILDLEILRTCRTSSFNGTVIHLSCHCNITSRTTKGLHKPRSVLYLSTPRSRDLYSSSTRTYPLD